MDDYAAYALLAALSASVGLSVYRLCLRKCDILGRAVAKASDRKQSDFAEMLRNAAMKLDDVLPTTHRESSKSRSALARAGLRFDPSTWHGITLLVLFLTTALGFLLAIADATAPLLLKAGYVALCVLLGWTLPRLYLIAATRKRRKRIAVDLPNALEMLALIVSTGQPVERAFRVVARASEGPLADEISLVDAEINLAGRDRASAMRSMAERCQMPQVSAFCSAVVQASEQGAPMANMLRGQARIARRNHFALIEEQANKIPVKQKIPLALCFLPAMFAIVIAPRVVYILNTFASTFG